MSSMISLPSSYKGVSKSVHLNTVVPNYTYVQISNIRRTNNGKRWKRNFCQKNRFQAGW